jgi:xanthine dehydrogenase accessory factor
VEVTGVREVFAIAAQWLRDGIPLALGTLVETYGSAPSPIGTTIAVDASGRVAGNIGAGCYESDIIAACLQSIADGAFRIVPINLTSTDEITGTAGCGGALKVAVWKPAEAFRHTAADIVEGRNDVALDLPLGFRCVIAAKHHLVIVGATSLAQEIARLARPLDFFVSVVDPRPLFATHERIPDAGELILQWPDEYLPAVLTRDSAVAVISHDPKFDLPALHCALHSDARYIGLLGSRRSQAARRDALRDMGFGENDLARIHGPAGLDLGGHSAAETALSILAEILAARNSRSGAPLNTISDAIHERSSVSGVSTS